MRTQLWLVLIIWVSGCTSDNGGYSTTDGSSSQGKDGPPGTDDSGPPPKTDGGSTPPKDKGPPPKPPGTSFATKSTSWLVPVPGAEVQNGFYATARAGYGKYWTTVDLDGDDKPDLVWTGDKDAKVWGNGSSPHWKLYKNSGSGFPKQALSWTVPDPGAEVQNGFYATGYSGYGKYWALVDLDGDDKPDLVWTGDKDAKVWGNGSSPHWKLYKNNGGGFDTKATTWPVPDPGAEVQNGFYAVGYSGYGKYWTLVDLDGDDKPDLVWTGDKDAKVFGNAAGSPHWRVYKNTGSGFAKQAVSWPVPDPGAEVQNGFYATGYSGYGKYWALVDLDGDDKPDLVWTGDKDAKVWGNGASPHWKLHKSYGGGFDQKAATWPVPDPGAEVQNGFYAVGYSGYGKYWTLVDLDADDKPDLVWTGDKDAKVWGNGSSPHWKLYKSTGSGFAKQPASWSVPDPGAAYASGFYATAFGGYGKYWGTFDLDGDRRPDLVWTGDKDAKVWGVTTATPHWGLFKNQ